LARDGSPHSYTGTNRDNEYGKIDGQALTYDAAGNLSVDEDGRHYYYDEYNRLVEVRAGKKTCQDDFLRIQPATVYRQRGRNIAYSGAPWRPWFGRRPAPDVSSARSSGGF
jgi:hypothetical protein